MEKGIIYLMKTAVDGLIKIGSTNDFESRMYNLETNGYQNVTGLKRQFAIYVENYKEKENMLHNIFSKSQVGNTELFTLKIDLAMQLLSSFDGKVIYPKEDKNNLFLESTEIVEESSLNVNRHHFKKVEFKSPLTNKIYIGKSNEGGTLSIIEKETGVEVPNYSNPSKKKIILYALKELGVVSTENETLYQLYRKLQNKLDPN